MARGDYKKGTIHAVIRTDRATGVAVEAIERDPDGDFWHVKEGADPVQLRDAEHVDQVVRDAGGGGDEPE